MKTAIFFNRHNTRVLYLVFTLEGAILAAFGVDVHRHDFPFNQQVGI